MGKLIWFSNKKEGLVSAREGYFWGSHTLKIHLWIAEMTFKDFRTSIVEKSKPKKSNILAFSSLSTFHFVRVHTSMYPYVDTSTYFERQNIVHNCQLPSPYHWRQFAVAVALYSDFESVHTGPFIVNAEVKGKFWRIYELFARTNLFSSSFCFSDNLCPRPTYINFFFPSPFPNIIIFYSSFIPH